MIHMEHKEGSFRKLPDLFPCSSKSPAIGQTNSLQHLMASLAVKVVCYSQHPVEVRSWSNALVMVLTILVSLSAEISHGPACRFECDSAFMTKFMTSSYTKVKIWCLSNVFLILSLRF